ncbi:MAG: rhamnulose-1-phosphate aldolase [Bacteroidales bacterium]|nr:rhamnulose-1-phosphate aldolase [Bacteroidales bacterium]
MIGNSGNLLPHTTNIFQKKELKSVFIQIAGIAQYLWDRGWAERNAGNFSINVTGFFNANELDRLSFYPYVPLSKQYPHLARTVFILSGTGTRMRDVANNPVENVCFIFISDSGSAYHLIDENPEGRSARPTSELPTHLAIQQQLLQKNAQEKVVLHAHVTELIALTQLAPFTTEKAVNSLLWGMHPETVLFLPDGVGFIPYTIPGTENIALETLNGFENHKVVLWEKHGCMTVANTLAEAFDNLDILAKAAKIYFLCKSTGMEPEGLNHLQLKEIRENPPADTPIYKKPDFSI